MALIFLGILVVIVVLLIGMYNSLVQLRVRCDNAWSDIDVQLKRRHDLIPNLVETVKGYATHEKGTFENIAKLRSQAMQATTPGDKAEAENQLSGALKSLFAVAENYPQLKASEEFTQLQGSLSQTEDTIQNARRYYNAVVRDLNTKIQSFPTNILAGMFGFQQRQFFEVAAADRAGGSEVLGESRSGEPRSGAIIPERRAREPHRGEGAVRDRRPGAVDSERFFRPFGAQYPPAAYARLAPWATFLRRFAA
jgi:LemA protein